jgi:hypothetical protein
MKIISAVLIAIGNRKSQVFGVVVIVIFRRISINPAERRGIPLIPPANVRVVTINGVGHSVYLVINGLSTKIGTQKNFNKGVLLNQ